MPVPGVKGTMNLSGRAGKSAANSVDVNSHRPANTGAMAMQAGRVIGVEGCRCRIGLIILLGRFPVEVRLRCGP
jgi:hypothetical protein